MSVYGNYVSAGEAHLLHELTRAFAFNGVDLDEMHDVVFVIHAALDVEVQHPPTQFYEGQL